MKKAILFIGACIILSACHKKPKDLIVGKWKPTDGPADMGTITFKNNGTASVQKDVSDSGQVMGYKISDDGKQIIVYPTDKVPASFVENRDLDQDLADIIKLDDDSLVVKADEAYHRFSRLR